MGLFTRGYAVKGEEEEEGVEDWTGGFRYTSINEGRRWNAIRDGMSDDKTGRDDRVSDRSE